MAPSASFTWDLVIERAQKIGAIVAVVATLAGGGICYYAGQASRDASIDTRIQIKGPLNDQTRADVEVLKDRSARSETKIDELERHVDRMDSKIDTLLERSLK